MTVGPRDLALLIDRLQVLFGRSAQISEGRDFAAMVTSEPIPVDRFKEIVELTRGIGMPPEYTSGLPNHRGKLPDQRPAYRTTMSLIASVAPGSK